ncbi:MAG: heme-degrading domain-containing protein [Lachnospiraceae bacterium]|nr:heme-degrading domain-containing protein [Lachnospiraceae bacterium]
MTVEEMQKEIQIMQDQQKELVFDEFTNDTAWELGCLLVKRAKEQELPVSLSITANKQRRFYYAFKGSAPTNDHFIARKENTVYECFKSSYEMTLTAELDTEHDFMDFWGLDKMQFVMAGGSFPITVKNVGVIGTVTCSGLAQEDDHAFIVSVLREFLEK